MLDTKFKKPKHKPVHQAGYVALSGMIVGSSHKQVHLQHNMNIALLTSQRQLCWDSLLGWIYQVPEQATLSNQHLQFQIFSRQCAELHLQLLVQYLVKSNKMKNKKLKNTFFFIGKTKKLKNTRYNTNSYSSGTVFSGWAQLQFWKKTFFSFLELASILEMVDTRDFGGTFGLGILSWRIFSLHCLELQPINLLQWLTYGGHKEVKTDVGRCTLEDPSKIGNWRRWLVFWNIFLR